MISLLVFLVCLCVPSGSGQDPPPFDEGNAMASVREYPTLLHKCTASFITPDVLITTARCLFWSRDPCWFGHVHRLSRGRWVRQVLSECPEGNQPGDRSREGGETFGPIPSGSPGYSDVECGVSDRLEVFNCLPDPATLTKCGDECSLFVQVLSESLMGNNKNKAVNVSSIIVNPLYDRVEGMDDVGLIKLTEKVNEAKVFNLPTELNVASGLEVATFTWKFTNNLQEYHLTKKTRKTLSAATCSLALKRYVGYREICTWGSESISAGPDDQGSPLISVKDNKRVLLGIYAKEGFVHPSKLELFEALYPSVEWIKQIINCDGNCSNDVNIEKKSSENPQNTGTPVTQTVTSTPFTPDLGKTTVKQTTLKLTTQDQQKIPDTTGTQPKGTYSSHRTETTSVSFQTTNTPPPNVTTEPIKTPHSTNTTKNRSETKNSLNADAVDENDDGVPDELSLLLA